MQLSSVLALLAVSVAAVNAETCDTTVLASLQSDSNVQDCASASGYSVSSLASPSDSQMALMCKTDSCQSALSALESANLGDCTIGTFSIQSGLIDLVTAYCASASGSTSGSANTNADATAGSTDEDAAGTVSPASSSSLDAEVTIAPANSTSSASAEEDVNVGDSASGSYEIETPEPTSASASESEATDTTSESASSSGSEETTDSGSNAAGSLTSTTALVGSAIVSVAALFL